MANLDTIVSSDTSSSLPVVRKIGIVDLKDALAKGIEDFRGAPGAVNHVGLAGQSSSCS
jgi:hypothetical protein